MELLSVSKESLDLVDKLKKQYQNNNPITMPGTQRDIILPDSLLQNNVDLSVLDSSIPLALIASKDPEPTMAMAASVRMSPKAFQEKLVPDVLRMIAEKTPHNEVRKGIDLMIEHDFNPQAIAHVMRHTQGSIIQARTVYSNKMLNNLNEFLNGTVDSKLFLDKFLKLSGTGNIKTEIQTRLICSLITSKNIRPKIKFMLLEKFDRLPPPIKYAIVDKVLNAPSSEKHIDILKEELSWIVKEDPLFTGKT